VRPLRPAGANTDPDDNTPTTLTQRSVTVPALNDIQQGESVSAVLVTFRSILHIMISSIAAAFTGPCFDEGSVAMQWFYHKSLSIISTSRRF
jgi:hypothetical protein